MVPGALDIGLRRLSAGTTLPFKRVALPVFWFAPRTAIRLVPMAISRLIWVLVRHFILVMLHGDCSHFVTNGTSWERTMNLCGLLVQHSSSGEFTEQDTRVLFLARASWIKDFCWERTKRLLARERIILFVDAMRVVVPTFYFSVLLLLLQQNCFRTKPSIFQGTLLDDCGACVWFVECIYLFVGWWTSWGNVRQSRNRGTRTTSPSNIIHLTKTTTLHNVGL
jgi:hypothetical protein